MTLGFVFSGQGSQYTGMGKDLLAEKVVRDTFTEASDLLGYDMVKLCQDEGELLSETMYTQPAILTLSTAILRLLEEKGYRPDIVAGLSLGEYTALIASGVMTFRDGVTFVRKRGQWMTEAAPKGAGKMVAVMNADRAVIEACCREASTLGIVSPANYNTPAQVVIGGAVKAVDAACQLLSEQGVKRLVPLNVSGPFHTALLKPAAEQLAYELPKLTFHPQQIPIISNTTAKPMTDGEIKDLLVKQVMSPVKWDDSVKEMKALGMSMAVEIGPGKTLSSFIRKIDKSIEMSHVEDQKSLAETLQLLEEI